MSAIIDFEPVAKVNEFAPAIAELATAQSNENAAAEKEGRPAKLKGYALTLTPRTGSTGKTLGVTGKRALFQQAARDAGYTATAQQEIENADGTLTIVFTLGAKHKTGPRKRADKK